MVRRRYVPDRGDIVWIDMNPQAGHEQEGRRPALVLSPRSYNGKTSLAVLCPITRQVKGYPFEVLLPEGFSVSGAVLSDQVRFVDWRARHALFEAGAPATILADVVAKLAALIGED